MSGTDVALSAIADPSRLSALASYGILDTPPEEGFDDIVQLASQICGTPIALVSLIAADRQWFKARAGLELCETPIGASVCAHTLELADILVIPDLTQDVRTLSNPLVTAAPNIRFYAGAPLRTAGGEVLGALCAIDTKPRPAGLTPAQAVALRALARQVMSLLELRRAVGSREAALARQHATLIQHQALIETQRAVFSASGDLDEILDALVAGAMRAHPQAEGGVILLREEGQAVYRAAQGCLATHGRLSVALHDGLAGSCILSGEPVLCHDARLDARVNHHAAEMIRFRSCVLVPVHRTGDVIGALQLQSSRPDAFNEDDVQVGRLFAGTVAAGFAEAGEVAARRAVHASDRRYKAVFESAVDYAIIVMDLSGRVVDWNEGATRMLGWTPQEMRGKAADVFFTPEDNEAGIPGQEMCSALEVGRGVDERWHRRKDGSRFWADGEMLALRDEAGVAIGFLKIMRDRTEQRDAQARVQASEASLRTILETVPVGILFAEAPMGRVVGTNRRLDEITGRSGGTPGAYDRWTAFDHADGRPVDEAELPLVRVLREARSEAHLQARYRRPDGAQVWLEMAAAPVRDAEGVLTGAVVAVSNIDDRKSAEEMQSLMNGELIHRIKNLLTIVVAITRQTLRGAADPKQMGEVLCDRLLALGRAHDIFIGGAADKTSLRLAVMSGLGVQADGGPGRVACHGPDIEISGKAALSLALMVHELSTNAVKYGALSTAGGHVAVTWSLSEESEPVLRFAWAELEGPPVVPPASKGFGSKLIERGLSAQVSGPVVVEYLASGVRCAFQAPLRKFVAP